MANTEEIKISLNENRYRALLPSKSEKMALNVGRGLTSETLQFDEIAFLYNIGLSLPAALAAGTAAMDRAKLNGDPYGIIYTTTAGKKDDRDGKYVYENIYRTSAKWAEALLDSPNAEALINAITKSSVGGNVRVLVEFQHRQLGYTDEWLRDTIKRVEAKGEAAGATSLISGHQAVFHLHLVLPRPILFAAEKLEITIHKLLVSIVI